MIDFQESYDLLDRYMGQRMAEARTPAVAIALTNCENTLQLAHYGVLDLERKEPVTAGALFEIGSIGKSFTAIAVLQAFETGRLDIHAPIEAYLPWFKVRSDFGPISAHHLLTHSAGLIRGTEFSGDAQSMVWALRESQTGFPPGARCYYSDIGYKILGLILQAVYDQPYRQIIREGILDPLKMVDTRPSITHAIRPLLPIGYTSLYDDRPNHNEHPLCPAPWLETDSGDGCIAATAEDMAKYLRMLLKRGQGPNGAIISESSYDLMTQSQIPGEGWIWGDYGYGLFVFERNGFRHIGHSGDMPGYEAYMAADLDNGYAMALLTAQPYPARMVWGVLNIFEAAYLGKRLPDLPVPPEPTRVENAADFAGLYKCAEKSLSVHAEGDCLSLDIGEERIVLEKRGTDTFYTPAPGFDIYLWEFGRSGAGENAPVVELCYGPDWYVNPFYDGPQEFESPKIWESYCGHYRSYNPWESNFRVIVRKGRLLLVWPDGYAEDLVPIQEEQFRVGEEDTSPERLRFDQILDGQAQRATLSNCPYYRFFTP